MNTIAIIILSLTILILFLYFADFKFELKFKKTSSKNNFEAENKELEKLSNTELNILKLLSNGLTNQEIADKLYISVHTVKKHISNIFKKLNLTSRTETRKYKDQINI